MSLTVATLLLCIATAAKSKSSESCFYTDRLNPEDNYVYPMKISDTKLLRVLRESNHSVPASDVRMSTCPKLPSTPMNDSGHWQQLPDGEVGCMCQQHVSTAHTRVSKHAQHSPPCPLDFVEPKRLRTAAHEWCQCAHMSCWKVHRLCGGLCRTLPGGCDQHIPATNHPYMHTCAHCCPWYTHTMHCPPPHAVFGAGTLPGS